MALVSIIMPSFNSAGFITETIRSVLAQDFHDWELLVSDDGSTDHTIALVQEFKHNDPRIQLIIAPYPSGSPAIARNRAIAQSTGRYIAFLDSDDLWTAEKLSKQLAFMQQNDLAFSYTQYQLIDENGAFLGSKLAGAQKITYQGLLAHQTTIGCLTVMFDTEKCGRQLMPDIRKRQDYAMWLKLLKQGYIGSRLNEQLALYRIRKGSVSHNKFQAALYVWRIYRDIEKLPLLPSVYYFLRYAWTRLSKQ